jgi:hypothetical protein
MTSFQPSLGVPILGISISHIATNNLSIDKPYVACL